MRHEGVWRRTLAVGVLISMIVAGVSAAAYASAPNESVFKDEGNWRLSISGRELRDTRANRENPASPSDSKTRTRVATPSMPVEDMLDQWEDASGTTMVEWFQTWLNGTKIRDSAQPSLVMNEGREIAHDEMFRYLVKVNFYTDNGEIQSGDSVTWNLGRFPGLSLPEEMWETLVVDGFSVADVKLQYDPDGTIQLTTIFTEEVDRFFGITVIYSYECGFKRVRVRTPLPFLFPGIEEPIGAFLLPAPGETDSSTDESTSESESSTEETGSSESSTEETGSSESSTEETGSSESSTEETRPSESSTEETSTEETRPTETSPPETTASRPAISGGASGGSSTTPVLTPPSTKATAEETSAPPETSILERKPDTDSSSSNRADETKRESESSSEETTEVTESEPAAVTVEAGSSAAGMVKNGDTLTLKIDIRNDGDQAIQNLFVRDYLPQHATYLSATDQGTWGILNGKQRVSWKLDTLEPGESRTLEVQVQVFPCTPKNYRLVNRILWQEDSEETVYTGKDPENVLDIQEITVG